MLAGRIIQIAKDILQDYQEFGVIERLQRAANVSTNRNSRPQEYPPNAQELREWAQHVIKTNKIDRYPAYVHDIVYKSGFKAALPHSLAKVIYNGFPSDPNMAISSGELNIYIALAQKMDRELHTIASLEGQFGIEPISIPENEIGLDIIIPRDAFDNDVEKFSQIQHRFISIIANLNELTTGYRQAPTLTYTSTSDPVTGVAVIAGTAWAVLNGAKLLLEVVEKSFSLHRTIKEFQAHSIETPQNIEDQVKGIVDKSIESAIDKIRNDFGAKAIQDGRANEVKTALIKDCRFAVEAMANGARISVTIESIDRLSLIQNSVEGVTDEKVKEMLESKLQLERRVNNSREVLEEPMPILLPKRD
jgi:hypothetical protein